jgi:hypothetical protein
MARMRDAINSIMDAPAHLTITQTDAMVVITDGDGRTTRLAPNGEKIKEENTGITRKTSWQGDDLVSRITGIGQGTITQTYSVDAEHHQLRVTLQLERGRGGQQPPQQAATSVMHRIYDADKM